MKWECYLLVVQAKHTRIPWAMQVRARACITRMPTSHLNSMATQHYSIVKHSFPITKKESSNKDCIVMFLAEKFVQIVIFSREIEATHEL